MGDRKMLIKYPYQVHYIEVAGNCNIAYMDEGAGEHTLLFIHGLANYAPVWKKNIEVLSEHYRCIAIDLPGNGLSDKNAHIYSMTFFADCVHHFIQELGLKNVTLVGHSMGGQIAITTLIKYPDCASSMVLCAPAGFETFSAIDKTLYYTTIHFFDFLSSEEQSLRKTIEMSFHSRNPHAEHIIKELTAIQKTYKLNYYRRMIEACIKGMIEEPVIDKLLFIEQPILILFGEEDALIPNRMIHHFTTKKLAEEAVKKLFNAQLKMLPNCGHFIQWEKSDAVNQHIREFLK